MEQPRRIDILVGVSGCGKTSLARTLLCEHERVIITDHRGEYSSFGPCFRDFDALADYCSSNERFVAVWQGDYEYIEPIATLALALRRVCLLLEETEVYPFSESGDYREAVLRGRYPAQVSFIALSQRPHLLPVDFRSQATAIYAFRNMEPSAIQWLTFTFGARAKELTTIPALEGLAWEWGEMEIHPFKVRI